MLGAKLPRAMHKGWGCWPLSHCLTVVPVIVSILLHSSPVVVPICTHNPSYEQWFVGMGVGAHCCTICCCRGGGHGC